MNKRIIVQGGISERERENRDAYRVLNRKGQMYALKSHIDKEQPMITRKYVSR